jgi:hypothetical protein
MALTRLIKHARRDTITDAKAITFEGALIGGTTTLGAVVTEGEGEGGSGVGT